jgi:hypothetical protein
MIAFPRIPLYRYSRVSLTGLAPPSIPDCSFEFSLTRKSKKLEKRAMREAGQRFRQASLGGIASGTLTTHDMIIL